MCCLQHGDEPGLHRAHSGPLGSVRVRSGPFGSRWFQPVQTPMRLFAIEHNALFRKIKKLKTNFRAVICPEPNAFTSSEFTFAIECRIDSV
jgi:hypothetical protein